MILIICFDCFTGQRWIDCIFHWMENFHVSIIHFQMSAENPASYGKFEVIYMNKSYIRMKFSSTLQYWWCSHSKSEWNICFRDHFGWEIDLQLSHRSCNFWWKICSSIQKQFLHHHFILPSYKHRLYVIGNEYFKQ